MTLSKLLSAWRDEQLGLAMISASLIVIGLIVGLLFNYQQKTREAEIRSQGVSMVRLLAEVPYGQLVPDEGRQGILQVMYQSQHNSEFAYGVVVDTKGNPRAQVSLPGIIIPDVKPTMTPDSRLSERTLALGDSGRTLLEFEAPLIKQGELAGHIRLGYFRPGYGLSYEQIPFFATLSLPIFLLTPLFYFLIRREIKPVSRASHKIQNLIEEGRFNQLQIHASGELGEFMQRFNQFINYTRGRIEDLESEQSKLLTSAKILSYKRSRIETVLHALPDAIMVLDESGGVSFVNDKLASLLGVSREEVLAHKADQWCRNPQVLAYLSRHETQVLGGYAAESMEFSPDNATDKTIQVTSYPIFSQKSAYAAVGTLVLFRDVTAEALAKRSRGEFVAHVAHELKSPLNVLAMYSEALQGEDGNSAEFRVEAINVINDEVERLASLINNLLNITKIEMGSLSIDRKRVRMRDLLQDAFENITRSGRDKDIQLHLELPKDMSSVSVDKDLLRVAVNNLLTNAIKYNKPGGRVTLSADESEQEISIRVRDTGIGIAPAEQQRIFDKFYRSEEESARLQSGHGLGLALAREIVLLHHGTLSVASTPGEGTEFTIELNKETHFLKQTG